MDYKPNTTNTNINNKNINITSLNSSSIIQTTATTITSSSSLNNSSIIQTTTNKNHNQINNDSLEKPIFGTRIPYAYISINPIKAISINNNSATKSPIKIAVVLHCKILTSLYKNGLISKELLEQHLSYLFDKIWVGYNLRVIESVPIEKISPLPKNFNKDLFLQDTKTLAYLQKYPDYISNLNNHNNNNNNDNNNNNNSETKKSISIVYSNGIELNNNNNNINSKLKIDSYSNKKRRIDE